MISYFIDVLLLQLLFALFFEAAFRATSLHRWNRFYLIFTPLLALILPLVPLPFFPSPVNNIFVVALNEVVISTGKAIEPSQVLTPDSGKFSLFALWLWGALLFTVYLFHKVFKLVSILKKGNFQQKENYTLVILPQSFDAFSFLRFICVGNQLPENHLKTIIAHEKIHLRLWHSLDLIYFEMLKVIFWFNPLHWIFQKRLSEIHEYQVDAYTRSFPFESVLIQYFEVPGLPLTHPFFKPSLIKKRLIMLRKHTSPLAKFARLTLLMPLLAAMLFYVSCKQEAKLTVSEKLDQIAKDLDERDSALTKEESKKLFDLVLKNIRINKETNIPKTKITKVDSLAADELSVPFAVIDEVPVFPGCENVVDEVKKDCFQEKINQHIRDNFQYPIIAQEMGIQGRVYVQFTINENGLVEDTRLRGPDPLLEQEVLRIIELLPQFIPGKEDGKPVKVPFSLPVNFVLNDIN